ncbi:hypothetical protein [Raoultibacter phocaeensis]|uniref:hypothetical protein n=1 Tax=Raoultibacter phocaeensis TaxID=2479841 RepID=UPI0015D59672|nr:hypothetical protein [Raoultibacter phocaeensis]
MYDGNEPGKNAAQAQNTQAKGHAMHVLPKALFLTIAAATAVVVVIGTKEMRRCR